MNELKEIRDRLNKLTWHLDDEYIFGIECAIDHIEKVLKEMENK